MVSNLSAIPLDLICATRCSGTVLSATCDECGERHCPVCDPCGSTPATTELPGDVPDPSATFPGGAPERVLCPQPAPERTHQPGEAERAAARARRSAENRAVRLPALGRKLQGHTERMAAGLAAMESL